MKDTTDVKRFLENWQDEVDSAAEYRTLAAAEPDPKVAQVYSNLARMEDAHTAFGKIDCVWQERLCTSGCHHGVAEY